MSAFSFAGGFAKRLGERQDQRRKGEAAALAQEAEDARYLERIALNNKGKLNVANAKIEADKKEAEKKLTANDFFVNGIDYNPFGKNVLDNTNKSFFFGQALPNLRNMDTADKERINNYIVKNPNDKGVQRFMSNVVGGGSEWLKSNTTVTDGGTQVRKLAYEKTGITSVDDFVFKNLTSENYRGRQTRIEKYGPLVAYSTDEGSSFFINSQDQVPANADKDSVFKIDPTLFGEENIANRYEAALMANQDGSIPRQLYEGASLYNTLQTEGPNSQKASQLFTEFKIGRAHV